MSLQPKTYEEAKARYKPLNRKKPLRSRPAERKRSAPKPRKRMKRATWREAVIERDKQCRWIHTDTKKRCRRKGNKLHAHHIHERSQRPDLRHEMSNGAALCGEHHDRLHHTVAGRQWARFLGLLGTETYEAAQKQKRNAA